MAYQNPEPSHAYGHQQGQHAQQESLLPQQDTGRYYGGGGQRSPGAPQDFAQQGDMGMAANPYTDYQNQRPHHFSPGPYGAQNSVSPGPFSPVSPAPQYNASTNMDYYGAGAGAGHSQQRAYESSIPPSYHTRPPSDVVSPLSPPPQAPYPGQASYQPYSGGSGVGRKPVQGSWREV